MNLHKTLFSCILITILIWLGKTASAQQNYPVLATLQLNAPYSLYLSDYTTPGTDKMQVNLFLKDLTKSNYPCRLRLRIEGFGMSIQSKNDFYVSPVYLSGGEMRMLSGADLIPYLQPSNLIFQGLDMGNFNRNGGKLPEGVYRFSIEVLDYYNRKVVSNTAGSVLSVFLSYPPIINIPSQNTTVRVLEPQNVMFQWVPRHTGSVNAAYHVAYKFRLVELIPTTRDANDAIRTSRPLYETFTDQTYFVYGPSEPTLTPGSNYAVQVQAVEAEGRDIFINNGNSEVIKFTYGEKCSVPSNIVAELDRHNSIKLSWMPLPMQQVFSVRYREAGHRNAEWFEQEVYLPKHILQGLRPGKTYEYQVRAQCTYGYGEYSDLQQFKLPDEQMRSGDFVCGKPETIAVAERSDLLTSISPGTVFMAGSFPVTVTDAIAVSGRISGKGTVGVPYLNQLNFNVEFNDILINSNLQLVSGKVSLSHEALDQSQEELLASVTVKPDANGQVQIGTQNGLPAVIDAAIGPQVTMKYESSTKTISIPVKTAEGKNLTIKVSGDLPQVFQDKEGETYEIDEQGKVVYKGKIAAKEFLAGGSLSNAVLNNIKAEVAFSAPNQKYGLDNFQAKHEDQSHYIKDYQKLKADKGDVYIGWKSVETGKTDEVEADVKLLDNSLDISKIEFRTGSGEKISSRQKGNKFTFSIIGSSEGNEKEIYAFYPTKTNDGKGYNLGKLNIASYKKIHKKVVIVPVNGAGAELNKEELENYLNKIYQAAVVAWDVETAPDFKADTFSWDIDKDGHLEAGNSSALSAYTTEQKKLAGLYKSQEGLKDNTYYIFLIHGFSKSDQEGYMVRSGQVGFVVANSSVKHTIAHELGHGTFNLPHTWDEYGVTQNSSNNLMDYSGGEELWHSQWNYLRNPDWVFRTFEGDDEGAYETDGHYSTVYLVSLMLGLGDKLSGELAKYTEAPDTYVHSEIKFRLNDTWGYPYHQKNTHALTDGFHGIEELMTALLFLYTDIQDLKEQGRLLHRFGDTYAHASISRNPNFDWKQVGGGDLMKSRVQPWEQWMNLLNEKVKIKGYEFLTNLKLQREYLQGMTLNEYLLTYSSQFSSDKLRMYGEKKVLYELILGRTFEHLRTEEGASADYIRIRPEWYLQYVRNLTELIAHKFNRNTPANLKVFSRMVDFGNKNDCKLKGIIDYEIAIRRNAEYVTIPVYYPAENHLVAVFDADKNDYLTEAKEVVKATVKYIRSVGISESNIKVIPVWEDFQIKKFATVGFDTLTPTISKTKRIGSYKIYFK
ncbi:fibronectin type III domain-containing protein [Rubrolithibacter danxiaensis]|uniref:fibronectin type III domain-containing protein n=1 Tax=Rubrolithibacter danxiaensis TaxID=3390805 RepID=UPI003BF78C5D